MNWIKQNKFLSGFIACMIVGVGALGFLLLKAQGRYGEVRADYDMKVGELNRLEGLKPYPETENLKKIEAQKVQHAAAVEAFHKNVAAAQIALEPVTREQFQDRLREAVTRITTKAGEKSPAVGLPAPFYLGMEKYQTEPPLAEAAPALGRQLKALEFVLTKMIDDGILAITKFDRHALPEEEGKNKKEKDVPPKAGALPAKAEKSSKSLVAYNGVNIDFTAEQSRFRTFLNGIAAEKSQFFVPRLVIVKNEKVDAPPRVQPGAPGAPGAPVPADDPNKPGGGKVPLIFGGEKVSVSLVLEIVDFAEVAAK